jgi:RES domain-containing protein
VVYAASHLSLSALEYLVHVDVEDVPADLVAQAIELPDDAGTRVISAEDLPADWRSIPAPASCPPIGDDWVAAGETLSLQVPSVLVPEEHNVLVNPAHPRAVDVRIVATRTFVYDPRLPGGRG